MITTFQCKRSTLSRFKLTSSSRQTFHVYEHRDLASVNSIYIYRNLTCHRRNKTDTRFHPSCCLTVSRHCQPFPLHGVPYLVVIRPCLFDRSTFGVRSSVMGSSASSRTFKNPYILKKRYLEINLFRETSLLKINENLAIDRTRSRRCSRQNVGNKIRRVILSRWISVAQGVISTG